MAAQGAIELRVASTSDNRAMVSAVFDRSISAGMRTTSRRFSTVTRRRIGATTSIMRKAAASASVMGKPRRSFFHFGSGIQTMRSQRLGTDFASGTKAMTSSAILGKTVPTSKSGHAAAAATTAESSVCSLGEV